MSEIETTQRKQPRFQAFRSAMLLFCAVLFPAAVLGVELYSRPCAEMFFNPIPTPVYIALVALVPISNALAYWKVDSGDFVPIFSFLNGAAIAVSFCYALFFLPLFPSYPFRCSRWPSSDSDSWG